MKTQIITALSIAAVLGTAGGAYAVNQTMLTSASNETSVIGSATPVLVPIAPKGADIPADYREQLARRPKHPLLGLPTSNVGSICGGSQPNIVPDACSIEVDRRTLPGETPPETYGAICASSSAR